MLIATVQGARDSSVILKHGLSAPEAPTSLAGTNNFSRAQGGAQAPRLLKRKGLIERIPHSNRYQLTPLGRRVTVLFTKTYGRVLAPGLVQLNPALPSHLTARSPLATAWKHLDRALDDYISGQLVAA